MDILIRWSENSDRSLLKSGLTKTFDVALLEMLYPSSWENESLVRGDWFVLGLGLCQIDVLC